jgi:hypothetical protein
VGEGRGGVGQLFRLKRERAFISVNPFDLSNDLPTLASQKFDVPAGSQFKLEIDFGLGGCERVAVDSQTLADLSDPTINAAYLPEDYIGAFGLYCAGSGAPGAVQLGPSWFDNVVFFPAE